MRADIDIDVADYAVDVLSRPAARAFVEQHHYSGTFPAARVSIGLFRRADLVGTAVFSVPMNQRAVPTHTGMQPAAGVELGRFVLLDDVPGNGESWFLARAMRLLRIEKPEVETVLSYSDPVERLNAHGSVVKPGHVGTIYQALSARYRGRTGSRTAYWIGDQPISGRSLSKIRLGERGVDYAIEQLHRAGAPHRGLFEQPDRWLERLDREGVLRRSIHPGNHAYVFPLTRRARVADRDLEHRPYPKKGYPHV